MRRSHAAAWERRIETLTPYEPIHLDSIIIRIPYFGLSVMMG